MLYFRVACHRDKNFQALLWQDFVSIMTVECVKNASNAFLLHRDQRAANAGTHTLLNALQ